MKPKKIKSTLPKTIRPATKMPVIHPQAAGIDVGSVEHFVCVPQDAVPEGEAAVRSFGGFSGELDQLVEWLQSCGVKTVAMESTGVFWIPLAQKLEDAGIEVVLVKARHLRQVPGRKTDVKDCQGLQQLHSYGLLQGSFRPAQDICCVRSLMRHRQSLTPSCGREVLHLQKALQQMNVHLHHVVSDLDGQTGLRILDAILAGERDARKLVLLRDGLCRKSTPEEMVAALQGDWRGEPLFVLGQALETHRPFLAQMSVCDGEMDRSRWRDSKAFSSWLGLCPGNKISGGKVLSSRTPHVVNRVSILLRTVAPSVGRSETWLGSFPRRMRARLGPAGANTATAHKLATLIYHLLKYKEEHIQVDRWLYEVKRRDKRLARLRKQAAELGFEMVQKTQVA
jgi:transposase